MDSTYARDISRMTSLAKWSYWAGHISEEEMWSFINQGAVKAGEIGKNWKEYTISFLRGRTIQGFDLEDLIVETNQIFHSKNALVRNYKDIDVYQKYSFK